eukprot:scaffold26735_cov31-Tisochrysis_lutea.AAC.2
MARRCSRSHAARRVAPPHARAPAARATPRRRLSRAAARAGAALRPHEGRGREAKKKRAALTTRPGLQASNAPAPHFVFPVQDVCCCAYRYVDWHVRLCRARPGCPFRRSWRGSGWRLTLLHQPNSSPLGSGEMTGL